MGVELLFDPESRDSIFQSQGGRVEVAAVPHHADAVTSPLLIDAAQIVVPEGETVVHAPVTPDESVTLPFAPDATFLVKLGDGNLAIKVGDVTVILEGYAGAANDPQHPVTIHAADGTVLDIATLLAATDPAIDIQTAAGPGGAGGNGADNTGAIFQAFGTEGDGLGGFQSVGGQGDSSGPNGFPSGDGDGVGGDAGSETRPQSETGPVNQAPETDAVTAAGREDTKEGFTVTLSGTDSDGSVAAFHVISLPAGGTLYTDAAMTTPVHAGDTLAASGGTVTLFFRPNPDSNGTTTFEAAAIDNAGTEDPTPATVTINVDPVNDAPVNTVPAAQSTNEDTVLAITGVLVADIDVGGGNVAVTLSVGHGTLDLASIAGLSMSDGALGQSSFTITGTVAAVNAALTGLSYAPEANYNGADQLNIVTSDLGNSGAGGALTDSDSVAITVGAVNDAPVNGFPGAQTTDEDTPLAITGLSVADVDAASGVLSVTLSVLHGTLSLTSLDGLTVTGGANGSGDVTIQGDLAHINAALANLTYKPDANYHGADVLTISTDDNGNSGSGGAKTTTNTVAITVTSINDAPSALDGIVVTNLDTAIIGHVTISDVESPNTALNVTLQDGPDHGTLTLAADGSFTYTPADGYTGTDKATVRVTDPDGAFHDADIAITVNAPTATNSQTVVAGGALVQSEGPSHTPVVALAGGGHVVTWQSDGQDGSGSGVYGRIYGADGNPVGAEFQINADPRRDEGLPSVAALANGGFVVVYNSAANDASGDVFMRLFGADGAPVLGADFGVNVTQSGEQSHPAVTVLDDGSFVVTWISGSTGAHDIYARHFSAEGGAYDNEFRINTTTAGDQIAPSITGLSDGSFVVSWTSDGEDGSGYGIFTRHYSAADVALGGETQVNVTTAGNQMESQVVGLAHGGYAVIWTSPDGASNGEFVRLYDNSGAAATGEILVNTQVTASQQHGAIAALHDGGFVVTWTSAGQDGNLGGIYAQRFDEHGVKVGGEVQINDVFMGNQDYPAVTERADGALIFTWSDNGDIAQKIVTTGPTGHTIDGGAGSDSLRGGEGNDTISGQGGDDLIFGQHGHDVLSGGDGHDVISVAGTGFTAVDGGAGDDVLRIEGGSESLTLAGAPITNIEEIDISGSGANALSFNLQGVLDITDARNALVITGGSDDSVAFKVSDWTASGTETIHGATYNVFHNGGATVAIHEDVQVVATP